MPPPANPSEIARDVLKLIAQRRLPPTPDNFRKLYVEVSGASDDGDEFPERFVKSLARQLPRDTAERQRLARQLDLALAGGAGAGACRDALGQYLESLKSEPAPAWNELIGQLLRQWEARHMGWTTARKRESLERVLSANDPLTLYARLQALTRSWAQAPSDPEFSPSEPPPAAPATASRLPYAETRLVAAGEAGEILASLRELLLVTLETVLPAILGDEPRLLHEAAGFATSVRTAARAEELQTVGRQLRKFAYRLELAAGDSAEVHAGILSLLRLLLENIDQIVVDDRWLHGQMEVLRDILAKPASLRLIDDAERRLREVIYKQSQLKHNLGEAQRVLKEMLVGLFDQFARLAESTGLYHDRIGRCAEKISTARDITEIGPLLDEVMRETRVIQEQALRSRDELADARRRALEAEARIAELQQALDETSRLMRHDQLTGLLNRRGLEETFEKESARALRRRAALCVALLDIDNFKRLNDTYGHQAGDDALTHLAGIVRENLRPHDTVARLGGEEFIILYPETDLEQAIAALVRLQRELTKAYFLADDNKVLITFSAGVTPWTPGEPMDAVIARADAAMYRAKQSGRNKVVAAEAGDGNLVP